MANIFSFLSVLIKKSKENELMLVANALTYKLLIAIFPFIIFLMTLLGFLDIDIQKYMLDINTKLPEQVSNILHIFIEEVIKTKRISLLSTSFFISIYSASTGFSSIIHGLNRVYGIDDNRSFFRKRFTSLFLVFIFAVLINFSLIIFIFSDYIKQLIITYTSLEFIPNFLDSMSLYILVCAILVFMVVVVYKISVAKRLKLLSIAPGAFITVSFWFILSTLFNIYINNFSRYSMIYGSIGSIFVLVIWINMISLVLLIGGQINAILENDHIL